jgi:hypothetical protein
VEEERPKKPMAKSMRGAERNGGIDEVTSSGLPPRLVISIFSYL